MYYSNSVFFLLLFCSLGLFSMDDGILLENDSAGIYIFPALVTAHVYPMRIYTQTSKLKVRKPFCAKKSQYEQFLTYTTMCERVKQEFKKAENEKKTKMAHLLQGQYEEMKKQHENIARSGKFFMYTASNKCRQFENPSYCLFRVQMEHVARLEHLKKVPGKPHDYQLIHTHNFMPQNQKAECDQTLNRLIVFFSHTKNEIHIGPLIIYTYTMLQKYKTWKLSKYEHEISTYSAGDWNLSELYASWPEHDTRNQLKELIERNSSQVQGSYEEVDEPIVLTDFEYNASPSSSPDSRLSILHDIVARNVPPQDQSNASSKKYKLS